MPSPLSDLDELVLKCRDEKAKSYIKEAVLCYKSFAFRSAIVSTWIAVSFDIIDKLRYLSTLGDREAVAQLEKFEVALQNNDLRASLNFENEILNIAKDKLQFISPIEFRDLTRLQEDRHRCAHPSMTIDGEVFNPSAEQARVHIRSAVEYLLQHPPVQGKYALDSLEKVIDSELFPTDSDKAITALKHSPLLNARKSLVRNFTIILLKKILNNDDPDYKQLQQITSALKAIESMRKDIYDRTLGEKFSSLITPLDDKSFYKVSWVVLELPESWEFLDGSMKLKLSAYVEEYPKEKLGAIGFFLRHKGLFSSVMKRIQKINPTELKNIFFSTLPPQLGDRLVELYADSKSFNEANSLAPTIIRQRFDFTKKQVEKLIRACGENGEIKGSHKVASVIDALRKCSSVNDQDIDLWLSEVELDEYVKTSPDSDDLEDLPDIPF